MPQRVKKLRCYALKWPFSGAVDAITTFGIKAPDLKILPLTYIFPM